MKIIYQGKEETTAQTALSAFLSEKGVDAAKAIVEYAGEIYAPGADLSAVDLSDGASLNVFKVVAGG